jgi:hypothetical protein
LSKKPKRSVVSEGEKRSAEEGRGGGFGKRFEREGSKENSKSAKGTGGWSGSVGIFVLPISEIACFLLNVSVAQIAGCVTMA